MQSVNLWNKSQWNSKIVRKWNNHTVSQWNNDMTCSITTTLPLYIYIYAELSPHLFSQYTWGCCAKVLPMHAVVSHNTPAGAVWKIYLSQYTCGCCVENARWTVLSPREEPPKTRGSWRVRRRQRPRRSDCTEHAKSIAIHSEAPPNWG